jgi:serine/threonine protein kinase
MSSAHVAPGDLLLDKYRVERVLGRGGMGVVVAARHVELRELFAIKLLLPAALHHPQAIERFVREARAAARLKSEHVARVQDVGRLPDGRPYMVLEHLAGKDLKETLRERGLLPLEEAVTYVMQACEAVAEAHVLGIVHRDLKPANLFLTRRANGTPCIKVLDFGISKQLEADDKEQHGLTRTGTLLGSPHYMAPEQMRRSKDADPRSDLWSLGCVLYELVTGRVPFHGENLPELVACVLQGQARRPSEIRPDVPRALEAVLVRCLAKSPEARYPCAGELARDLGAALSVMTRDDAAQASATANQSPPAAPSLSTLSAPGWSTTQSPRAGRWLGAGLRAGLGAACIGLALVVIAGFTLAMRAGEDRTARRLVEPRLAVARQLQAPVRGDGPPTSAVPLAITFGSAPARVAQQPKMAPAPAPSAPPSSSASGSPAPSATNEPDESKRSILWVGF